MVLFVVWPCWSRYDLVGGSVSQRVGFEVSEAQARPSVALFLLPANPEVEFAATSPALCLPHDDMLPTMMIMD